MNKGINFNVLNYYLSEYYNYNDADQELHNSVINLLREYSVGEADLLRKLEEHKKTLYSTVEDNINESSKTLSREQLSILNSFESKEQNAEYYLDIKKLIDQKLAYMKDNVGKDSDEIQAIDNIVNEITSTYASNIESLSKIIKMKREFNEALTNYRTKLKFTIMAFAKALNITTTNLDSNLDKERKEAISIRKNKLLEKLTLLLEDARFHDSFANQSESDIEILKQAYETNVDRLYKVKMSYDYLLFEAYNLYNANAAIETNSRIDSISEELPDYDTQDFVTQESIKKPAKKDVRTLNDESLKRSIERTANLLNNSYTSLKDMRKVSSILTPMLKTQDEEESKSNSMIKLVMSNSKALDPINNK